METGLKPGWPGKDAGGDQTSVAPDVEREELVLTGVKAKVAGDAGITPVAAAAPDFDIGVKDNRGACSFIPASSFSGVEAPMVGNDEGECGGREVGVDGITPRGEAEEEEEVVALTGLEEVGSEPL